MTAEAVLEAVLGHRAAIEAELGGRFEAGVQRQSPPEVLIRHGRDRYLARPARPGEPTRQVPGVAILVMV